MGVVGYAITGLGEPRIALAGGEAAADSLHFDCQIDEVLDRLVVLLQAHRMGQCQRQSERELRLRQPAIEVVPDQPADDRLWRFTEQEDVLPRDEDVVEPHLAIELVVAAAERGYEGVPVAYRDLAADCGDPGRVDRDDEGRAMPVDL